MLCYGIFSWRIRSLNVFDYQKLYACQTKKVTFSSVSVGVYKHATKLLNVCGKSNC